MQNTYLQYLLTLFSVNKTEFKKRKGSTSSSLISIIVVEIILSGWIFGITTKGRLVVGVKESIVKNYQNYQFFCARIVPLLFSHRKCIQCRGERVITVEN